MSIFYYNRGNAKAKLGYYSDALIDYDTAIKLYPEDYQVYYARALSKIIIGDKEGGYIDFSKAGELGYLKAYEAIKKYCK